MRIFLLSALISLLVSGCDHTVHALRNGHLASESMNSPYQVKPTVSTISLQLQQNGNLQRHDIKSMNTLLRNQGRLSNQTIRLQPYTDQGEVFAIRLQNTFLGLGVTRKNIIVLPTQYRVAEMNQTEEEGQQKNWDLSLTSEALVVTTEECSIQHRETWSVTPYDSVGTLGCANRANLAQMVADPRDLMRGRVLDPVDGIYAVESVTRYHESDVTPLIDIDFNDD